MSLKEASFDQRFSVALIDAYHYTACHIPTCEREESTMSLSFLVGCSGNESLHSTPERTPEMVEIPGVGKVLDEFRTSTDRFDIDMFNLNNRHNEANVRATCLSSGSYWFSEWFSKDTTDIEGKRVGDKGYELSVTINSESGTLMWNGDVTTRFRYDGETDTWRMSSVVFEDGKERPYKYCDPAFTFETLLASLECYVSNNEDGDKRASLTALVASIGAHREDIVRNSGERYSGEHSSGGHYEADKCEESVDPLIYQYPPDVPIPD
jgi:hypothetical protein